MVMKRGTIISYNLAPKSYMSRPLVRSSVTDEAFTAPPICATPPYKSTTDILPGTIINIETGDPFIDNGFFINAVNLRICAAKSKSCSMFYSRFLKFTEELRLDHDAKTQAGMELVVVEKILTVTVVVLEEKILVLALEQAVIDLPD